MKLPIQEWATFYLTVFATIGLAFETVEEAAIIARTLVDSSKTSVATMATIYPVHDVRLPGSPFSLQEYYASCYRNGSLSLLFLPISRHSQNVLHSPIHSASISITAELPSAHKPRVSLIGNITIFSDGNTIPKSIQHCYTETHPDSKQWLPGDKDAAHVSYWARFDPHSIYFVGGFGGTHYIGYIPLPLYQAAQGISQRVVHPASDLYKQL